MTQRLNQSPVDLAGTPPEVQLPDYAEELLRLAVVLGGKYLANKKI
jgi:hypothetical protein